MTWTSMPLFPAVLRNRVGGLLWGPEHRLARRKENIRAGMWGWSTRSRVKLILELCFGGKTVE